MSKLLALMSTDNYSQKELVSFVDSINLSGNSITKSLKKGKTFFAASSSRQSLFKEEGLFENKTWIILFAGDLVEHLSIPFSEIAENIGKNNLEYFAGLNGTFAITAFSKEEQELYILSDRRSQQPIYYYIDSNNILISTEMASFCRLKENLQFNENWLWEYLFFNYPVSSATFLRNVRRVPPATIVRCNVNTRDYYNYKYAANFRQQNKLLEGKEALSHAFKVFSDRVPKYYSNTDDVACALTAGWDGRTMLAFAPDQSNVTAYTYGVPGCNDLKEGRATADEAKISHVSVLFDNEFIDNLEWHMNETVYLTSGLQNIARASLLYAYKQLTRNGTRCPLVISGIAVDMQFRGHACTPALISSDMGNIFKSGFVDINKKYWSGVVKGDFRVFEEYLKKVLQQLRDKYGDYNSTEHHLSFINYILSTQYFSGEISIADYYTTVRVPSWDSEIIKLSYAIKYSTLLFSQFSSHSRGNMSELILQSYLLKNISPTLSKIRIGNTRPDIVLLGVPFYHMYRAYRGIVKRVARFIPKARKIEPLEDWREWLNNQQREYINRLLFVKETRVRKYIQTEFLEELKTHRNLGMISKLATVEIIIRLIESKWKRNW